MAGIYIETFGCQMNEADSQYLADRATSAGYSVVERPEQANVVIVNTCTVRDNAERRAYGRINHFKLLKRSDPELKLVVTGCLAEQDRDRMSGLVPHVDAIFGTSELAQLGDRLESWRPEFAGSETSEERLLVPFGGSADCVTDAFSHLRGFVTVQRGCSYYCTFCIVPHVRGRFDHRPMNTILSEAQERIDAGVREVMLVGQTVNAYRDPATGEDFGELCRAVAALEGLERLTFISPHPKDFNEKIVRDLAAIPQMNPRIHLPLQSASDRILRRMNRKYTLAQFAERVQWFRRDLPDWAITTDFIVGFPGETEEDFCATLDYVKTGVFANAYMFIYSPRRGTAAARWEQTPREIVSERFNRLVAAQNEAARAYNDRKVGTTVRALISGVSKKDATKLSAKTGEGVTVVAPMPPDYDSALYAREPWLDIFVETARVWGCTGRITGRASKLDATVCAVERAPIDLLAV